jgi:hypothetical protein
VKVASLLDVVNLAKAKEANEFTARAKYEHSQQNESLMIKFNERFSASSTMPTEIAGLKHQEKSAIERKSLIDLSFSDWELLRFAYGKAVEHNVNLRIDRRKENQRKIINDDNLHATLQETSEQKFRILMMWLSRFHMEKLFHGARIQSVEEFKAFLSKTFANSTEEHRVQLGLFLKQFGLDPKHSPSLFVFEKMTGKDRQILQKKAEDQRNLVIDFTDIRLKMAQLNASAHFAHTQNLHIASVAVGEALLKVENLTEIKIKAVK